MLAILQKSRINEEKKLKKNRLSKENRKKKSNPKKARILLIIVYAVHISGIKIDCLFEDCYLLSSFNVNLIFELCCRAANFTDLSINLLSLRLFINIVKRKLI